MPTSVVNKACRLGALLACLLLAVPCPAPAQGAGGVSAYEFARLAAEPVGRALSGAHVGSVEGPAALGWNPAGLCGNAPSGALLSHASWIAGTAWQWGAVSLRLPDGAGAVGISAGMLRVGSLDGYAADGTATGSFTPYGAHGSIAYARSLGERWRLGLCGEFFLESDGTESPAQTWAGGFGLQFHQPLSFGSLAVGLAGLHLAPTATRGEEEFSLPASIKAGLSLETATGIDLHLGTETLLEGETSIAAGLAWRPLKGLAALGGFTYLDTGLDSPFSPSMGLEVEVGPTQVAYSYQLSVIDEGSHQVSLMLPFQRP